MLSKSSAPLWERDLSLPGCAESLAQMRNHICYLLSELPIPDPVLFDIRVAVGEALANAIRHGSPRGECDTIEVAVAAYRDRVKIEVTDHGAGFDGRPAGQLDPYAPSGRGVPFMRALMDGVDFAYQPGGGTTVTLVKHLEWSEAQG
jgi:serine/threonine-protein kinase RsbW